MTHTHTSGLRPSEIASQPVSLDREPLVKVGIVCGERICFALRGAHLVAGRPVEGYQEATVSEGRICWEGGLYDELCFEPCGGEASFALHDVTIGIHFHWERRETQVFRGVLRLVTEQGRLRAINELPVEDYLRSVISSEMSSHSGLQLLKAHAVISRSWLLAQMWRRRHPQPGERLPVGSATEGEVVRWYDQEDHQGFDVCADDHCQRYQGITRETDPRAAQAIAETRGELLTSGTEICDARFSKCCGGAMEEFQYCWADTPKPYLRALADTARPDSLPDLTDERQAREWICSSPESFCNTRDRGILAQVLNGYDRETTDFYRWRVEYTQAELAGLIARKTGMDFGRILDLVPVERGRSGRMVRMRIVGEHRTLVIGKELEIRRALSESHLYSSAFVVDRMDLDAEGCPARFVIRGAGWGHGVGLCQIGAAMMGEQGYAYRDILHHYYPGADITRAYP